VENPTQINLLARRIFEEYIQNDAPLQINIGYNTQIAIVEALNEAGVTGAAGQQQQQLPSDVFEEARKEVYETLKNDVVERWKISLDYKEAVILANENRVSMEAIGKIEILIN